MTEFLERPMTGIVFNEAAPYEPFKELKNEQQDFRYFLSAQLSALSILFPNAGCE